MLELGVPREFTATGDISSESTAVPIKGFVLTAAAVAAVAEIREGGSGGTIRLTLKAPVQDSRIVPIPMAIRQPHLTLTGAGALLTAFM